MTGLEIGALMAATQLIGGLLGNKAAAEQQKTQGILQAGQTQFGLEQQARQTAEAQQQGALGNLVEAYRSALMGGR
jgi:hypothetical protein